MKKGIVLGIGINDADYPVGRTCPFYKTWLSMLERCYSPRSQKHRPTYQGCSVVREWHRFSTFKIWMEKQDWEGKHLDKDLLVHGNKEYGPSTCIFVSNEVNCLFHITPKRTTEFPVGVFPWGNRFKASIKKSGKSYHIGMFDSIEEAVSAYKNAKADWIRTVARTETCPTTKEALLSAATRYERGVQ